MNRMSKPIKMEKLRDKQKECEIEKYKTSIEQHLNINLKHVAQRHTPQMINLFFNIQKNQIQLKYTEIALD